jgi:hypothetical protein
VKLLVDGGRSPELRQVNPTQLKYILSTQRIKAYKGPAGCAKTSTGVADVLIHALLEPGSKYLIARQDYNDLLDTTMQRCEDMVALLPPGTLLDRNKSAPAKWYIRAAAMKDDDGRVIDEPSQITFMGLKDVPGSYEWNGAFVDEADEVDEKSIHWINSRLRWKRGHKFIGLAFNPPDINHWLYTACTGMDGQGNKVREPWMQLFEPNPKENTRNLPSDYYEILTRDLPEDMRQRLVDGVWGSTFPGEAVVRQFRKQMHLRELAYASGTLFRFWDFGYNRPAVLFCQWHRDGRLQVMREFLGHHIEGSKFIEVVKAKTTEWFPGAQNFMDYGDPAVAQKKDTGQMSAMLNNTGITIRYMHTPFDVSMALLRKKFESLIEGEPAIVIDSRYCPILSGGLAGGYHLKKDGVTPNKDGYYDHLVDALRYGVYNLCGAQANTTISIPQSIAYWSSDERDEART